MTREPFTVEAGAKVADAVRILVGSRIGGLPVVEGGILVGVFTEGDALGGYLGLLEATEAAVLRG